MPETTAKPLKAAVAAACHGREAEILDKRTLTIAQAARQDLDRLTAKLAALPQGQKLSSEEWVALNRSFNQLMPHIQEDNELLDLALKLMNTPRFPVDLVEEIGSRKWNDPAVRAKVEQALEAHMKNIRFPAEAPLTPDGQRDDNEGFEWTVAAKYWLAQLPSD